MDEALEAYLKALLALVGKHRLADLRLEGPDLKIRLSTGPGRGKAESVFSHRLPTRNLHRLRSIGPIRYGEPAGNHLYELRSPLVGVFYRSATPGVAPFVEPGDYVRTGHVVCLIEAMKVFNEICAERAGRLVEVCVENGEVVETDQVLMRLDISAPDPEGEFT